MPQTIQVNVVSMKSLPKHEPKVIYISSFKRDSKIYPCCIAMIESVDEIFLF